MKLPQLGPQPGTQTKPPISKIGPVSTDRTGTQAPVPATRIGAGENQTRIFTYFTKTPNPSLQFEVLYNGDRMWSKVTLTLETAGPVAVGDSQILQPVLSGKGQLLETNVPTPFIIAKGTRIYVAATTVNRIKVVVEPLPWLEVITGLLGALVAAIRGAPQAIASKL